MKPSSGKSAARRRRGPDHERPRIVGRCLRVGPRQSPLFSGAIHYWRLEPDVWRPALIGMRDLGLDIVDTYAPWGVHEVGAGEFDFGERDPKRDLGRFLDLAHELSLWVILRPGPHINAEMTYFGLPERIVYDKACQARSPRQNPVIQPFPPRMFPVPSYASTTYHRETGRWFDAVAAVAAPRLAPAGPVVLVQVDNEAAYYFRNGVYDQDYHPDAIALYRKSLERRHGTLKDAERAHRRSYATWDDIEPPDHFDAPATQDLPAHLDWAAFQEELVVHAIGRMKRRLVRAGFTGVPMSHNLPLGDMGLPVSVPALDKTVDLVGFDYYHAAREHRTIKRRTLYLTGTVAVPYAPELGAGAPPWFTPLDHEDSLFCAMCACAYGLRGFNIYMAVDRDRWYGAPIDARGLPRPEAQAWKRLIAELRDVAFHDLDRHTEVALVVPQEYRRLSRVTHLLGGLLSPSNVEAVGGTPVDACNEDPLGFKGPVQVLWWRMLAKLSDALTEAGIPYVYVDSDAPLDRLRGKKLIISPVYEFVCPERWDKLLAVAREGATVIFGPAVPELDDGMRPRVFEAPEGARRVLIDTLADAHRLVHALAAELGLARPFPVDPRPVETCVHSDALGPRVLFVIHPAAGSIDANVELPGPMVLTDLMTGEQLEGDSRVAIHLEPQSCRLFELSPITDSTTTSGNRPPRARRTSS